MLTAFEKKQVNTQAKRDLVEKLRLEKTFKPEIKSLFNTMREDFKVSVAATGSAQNATDYSASWKSALRKHYKRVQKSFRGSVEEFQKSSLIGFEIKQNEDDNTEELLSMALLAYANSRASEQEQYITQTNEKQMNEAVAEARELHLEQELPMDNRSIAATAAAILGRKLNGRVEGIATLETQAPAESTKLFEARALSGLPPSPTAVPIDTITRPRIPEVTKTWRTIGDAKVRNSHKNANFQKVNISDPFIVMGQRLMYPGDNSLGATVGNTINCRCASVYSR